MSDFGVTMHNVPIFCDNTSAINITKNPVQHPCTKHIDIRHHFIRDNALKGDICIEHVDTLNQLANIFTKPFVDAQFCLDYLFCFNVILFNYVVFLINHIVFNYVS